MPPVFEEICWLHIVINICKDKYAKAKLSAWYCSKDLTVDVPYGNPEPQQENKCAFQTVLVCEAFTLVTSSYFAPNQCEFCELINISFLFQGLHSTLISFCCLVPIDIDPTLLFIASHPRSLFFDIWCDSLYIPLPFFFPKLSFPLLIFPESLLSSHQDLSYLFSCSYRFGSPWPAWGQFSLHFLIVPESYPLSCGSCTF